MILSRPSGPCAGRFVVGRWGLLPGVMRAAPGRIEATGPHQAVRARRPAPSPASRGKAMRANVIRPPRRRPRGSKDRSGTPIGKPAMPQWGRARVSANRRITQARQATGGHSDKRNPPGAAMDEHSARRQADADGAYEERMCVEARKEGAAAERKRCADLCRRLKSLDGDFLARAIEDENSVTWPVRA